MRPTLILTLTLLLALPLAALAWLGLRMAGQEREVVENRFREALTGRLKDIDSVILKSVDKRERELLKTLERDSYEAGDLRSLTRESPLIHTVFVLDAKGNRVHPPPEGPLTAVEKEFLERSGQIWRDKQLFYSSSDAAGVNIRHGWYTWYWGNGVNLLFWTRDASNRVIAAECDRSRLLADIVGELPNSNPDDPNLPHGRIALMDGEGAVVYQWGAYDPASGELPRAKLALDRPLNAWSLAYFAPTAELDRALSSGTAFNLIAGGGALALALAGLAFYFYRESTREMREAAERVSFVNQVSHELKTPLTNIRMYAELLDRDLPDDDPRSAAHLGVILSESQRLSRLIGNVLTFARQRNNKLNLQMTAGVVDSCVQLVLDHFRPALESKGVQVTFNAGAGAMVTFDHDAVEQILGNLFSNVEKYAPNGGVMEVTSHQEKDVVTIVVADRGPGIPKGQEERIFEPFHRLSNKLSDGVAGTGIGLSIARELARKHGGDLRVEPSSNGARFHLEIRTPKVKEPA
ncbi:MAG TPA: HAMP domain-containing sensor histidine kinase [Terriglobia bacterium]|nr:HAMP domain-containing sensor histidine kinase [Terriglobia bacterium]